jgi:hypothetical protein
MRRRELLKLGPSGVLGLLIRPRVQAETPRIRRSKPYMEGLERGALSREDIRRIEER